MTSPPKTTQSCSSPRSSPRVRAATTPSPRVKPLSLRVPKRIIVCCDGTWQDGLVQTKCWQYSNILKLSRMLRHEDTRHDPPIHQIMFYQKGVGTENNFFSRYIQGATGASLPEKVREAYAFIANNYHTGDEIFLFGFSRGAYTARMCASIIGEIGVLDKQDMDSFSDIFIAYQKRGKTDDQNEIAKCNQYLERFTNPSAKGRLRADADGDTFTIKVVGVFDTVGSFGLPEELKISKQAKRLFGFPDKLLGSHIQHAFHAMALNETRADFNVAKFEQTQKGRDKGQVLKQVWFAGSHTDIGGGWPAHDLSDMTMAWMAANIEKMVSLDIKYMCRLPNPAAPWGSQPPHNPQTGIFKLGQSIRRNLPTETNNITHEFIHPSVMLQTVQLPQLLLNVKRNPALLCTLAPLEEQVKVEWSCDPGPKLSQGKEAELELEIQASEKKLLRKMAKETVQLRETVQGEGDRLHHKENVLGLMA